MEEDKAGGVGRALSAGTSLTERSISPLTGAGDSIRVHRDIFLWSVGGSANSDVGAAEGIEKGP